MNILLHHKKKCIIQSKDERIPEIHKGKKSKKTITLIKKKIQCNVQNMTQMPFHTESQLSISYQSDINSYQMMCSFDNKTKNVSFERQTSLTVRITRHLESTVACYYSAICLKLESCKDSVWILIQRRNSINLVQSFFLLYLIRLTRPHAAVHS